MPLLPLNLSNRLAWVRSRSLGVTNNINSSLWMFAISALPWQEPLPYCVAWVVTQKPLQRNQQPSCIGVRCPAQISIKFATEACGVRAVQQMHAVLAEPEFLVALHAESLIGRDVRVDPWAPPIFTAAAGFAKARRAAYTMDLDRPSWFLDLTGAHAWERTL